MSQERELWVHPSSGQRYLLPKGVAFAQGEYPITSVSGQRWLVHEKEVQLYAASEAEVQLFMLADLRQALGTGPFLRARIDSDSEDSSDWDSDSESDEIEQALTQVLHEGVSEQGINRFLAQHPEVSKELQSALDAELSKLRQSFADLGSDLTGSHQPLTEAAMLRAFGERLIAQADKLEAEAKNKDA